MPCTDLDLWRTANSKFICHVLFFLLFSALAAPVEASFMHDSKVQFLQGSGDHWILRDRAQFPVLVYMTVCVHVRVLVPGEWTAYMYGRLPPRKPDLALQGDSQSLYVWLLGVRHSFPVHLLPRRWYHVCLKRDTSRHRVSLDVDGSPSIRTLVAENLPSAGELVLGSKDQSSHPSRAGMVELYLFRVWDDIGPHGVCEDGGVVAWRSKQWDMGNHPPLQDESLLCAILPSTTAAPIHYPPTIHSPHIPRSTTTNPPLISTQKVLSTISPVINATMRAFSTTSVTSQPALPPTMVITSTKPTSPAQPPTTVLTSSTRPPTTIITLVQPTSSSPHSTTFIASTQPTSSSPHSTSFTASTQPTSSSSHSTTTFTKSPATVNVSLPAMSVEPMTNSSTAASFIVPMTTISNNTPVSTTNGPLTLNCSFPNLCVKKPAWYWMVLEVQLINSKKNDSSPQDIKILLQSVFNISACVQSNVEDFLSDSNHFSVREEGTCKNDNETYVSLFEAIEVACDDEVKQSPKKICTVLLLLRQLTDPCVLHQALEANKMSVRLLGTVERVGVALCTNEEVLPVGSGLEKCSASLPLPDDCHTEVPVTCKRYPEILVVPVDTLSPVGRNCTASDKKQERGCDCSAFCNQTAAYYTLTLGVTDPRITFPDITSLIYQLSSTAQTCNSSDSYCTEVPTISEVYQECFGMGAEINNCTVVLKLVKAVLICSLRATLVSLIEKKMGIFYNGSLTRVAICGWPAGSDNNMSIANFTWISTTLEYSQICQNSSIIRFDCKSGETLGVPLTEVCLPRLTSFTQHSTTFDKSLQPTSSTRPPTTIITSIQPTSSLPHSSTFTASTQPTSSSPHSTTFTASTQPISSPHSTTFIASTQPTSSSPHSTTFTASTQPTSFSPHSTTFTASTQPTSSSPHSTTFPASTQPTSSSPHSTTFTASTQPISSPHSTTFIASTQPTSSSPHSTTFTASSKPTSSSPHSTAFIASTQPTSSSPHSTAFTASTQPTSSLPHSPTFPASTQPTSSLPRLTTFTASTQPTSSSPHSTTFTASTQPTYSPHLTTFTASTQPTSSAPHSATFAKSPVTANVSLSATSMEPMTKKKQERGCDCSAFCNQTAAYYTLTLGVTDPRITFPDITSLIYQLSSTAQTCNSSDYCTEVPTISEVYQECFGMGAEINNCTVVLKLVKAVHICSLRATLVSLIEKKLGIFYNGSLTRVAICGWPAGSDNNMSIANFTWISTTLEYSQICQNNSIIRFDCKGGETLGVPLTEVCMPSYPSTLITTSSRPNTTTQCNATFSSPQNMTTPAIQPYKTESLLNTTAAPWNFTTPRFNTSGVPHPTNKTVSSLNITRSTAQVSVPMTTASAESQAEQLLDLTRDISSLNSSQVDQLVTQLEGLLSGPNVSLALGRTTITIVSNLLNASVDTLASSSNRIIGLVYTVGLKLVVQREAETILSDSVALAVKKVNGANFQGTSFLITDPSNLQMSRALRAQPSSTPQGSITLPPNLTIGLTPQQQLLASRVQFNFYQKSTVFQDRNLQGRKLNSGILGTSVANLSISNLTDRVFITLRNNQPVPANFEASCVFWDFSLNDGRGGWNPSGCVLENSTNEETNCSCSHLTSFAVLLDISGEGISNRVQSIILTYISHIGCGISAIFLSITLLTYLAFKKLRKDIPSKILIQLCTALLLLNLTFLLDSWLALFPEAPGLCISTAFFLHYFLLVSFSWMCLEAVHMYLAIVKVFNTYVSRGMLKFSLVGWGVPLVVVIIVIAINNGQNYGLISYGKFPDGTTDNFCWLKNDVAFYVAVVAYFCVVFLVNLTMFVVVIVQLFQIKRQNPHNAQHCTTLQNVRSVVGLTILLGLTWGFAFFAWGPVNLAFMYLFAIFNSLQGFFIFIFHCAIKENVRRQWRTYLCCGKLWLPENTEWSRTATHRRMANKHAVNKATSFGSSNSLHSSNTSSSSFLVNDSNAQASGIGSMYEDRQITALEELNGDVVLNDIHSRPRTPQGQ